MISEEELYQEEEEEFENDPEDYQDQEERTEDYVRMEDRENQDMSHKRKDRTPTNFTFGLPHRFLGGYEFIDIEFRDNFSFRRISDPRVVGGQEGLKTSNGFLCLKYSHVERIYNYIIEKSNGSTASNVEFDDMIKFANISCDTSIICKCLTGRITLPKQITKQGAKIPINSKEFTKLIKFLHHPSPGTTISPSAVVKGVRSMVYVYPSLSTAIQQLVNTCKICNGAPEVKETPIKQKVQLQKLLPPPSPVIAPTITTTTTTSKPPQTRLRLTTKPREEVPMEQESPNIVYNTPSKVTGNKRKLEEEITLPMPNTPKTPKTPNTPKTTASTALPFSSILKISLPNQHTEITQEKHEDKETNQPPLKVVKLIKLISQPKITNFTNSNIFPFSLAKLRDGFHVSTIFHGLNKECPLFEEIFYLSTEQITPWCRTDFFPNNDKDCIVFVMLTEDKEDGVIIACVKFSELEMIPGIKLNLSTIPIALNNLQQPVSAEICAKYRELPMNQILHIKYK